MRKSKQTTIGDGEHERDVTVLELSVGQLIDGFNELTRFGFGGDGDDESEGDGEGGGLEGWLRDLDKQMGKAVEGLTLEECRNYAPSELEALWEDFREVNAVFFKGLGLLVPKQKLDEILETGARIFLRQCVGSFGAVSDTESCESSD